MTLHLSKDFFLNQIFFFLLLFQLDKSVITDIATGDPAARNKSLIKVWCKQKKNTVRSQHYSQVLEEVTGLFEFGSFKDKWQEGVWCDIMSVENEKKSCLRNVKLKVSIRQKRAAKKNVGLEDPRHGLLSL